MSRAKASIEEYTPCRTTEIYLDNGSSIEYMGKLRLKGMGRTIWLMLDGKNSISKILDYLCIEFSLQTSLERAIMKKELIELLSVLETQSAIIVNWDPIYKLHNCQELKYK